MTHLAPKWKAEEDQQTLFFGNIDQSVKRDDLQHALYELCNPFGEIFSIVINKKRITTKTIGKNAVTGKQYDKPQQLMKTIAFVCFDDYMNANQAKARLHGFPFFGRDLYVQFAKSKSIEAMIKEGKIEMIGASAKRQKVAESANSAKQITIKNKAAVQLSGQAGFLAGTKTMSGQDVGDPTCTLIIDNLTEFLTEEIMRPLFEQYPGLEELQVFTTQKRMKVEFRHEDHAKRCLQELQGFNVDGRTFLSIVYGM
ncbi:unnamed protein product [Amoebophrya sp. A120]|nr:unnamed protein product [Amoebophrya sp. A120]|eukprot:GSA120T00009931001.1